MSEELLRLPPNPPHLRLPSNDEMAGVVASLRLPHLLPRPGGRYEDGTSHVSSTCITCGGVGQFKFWKNSDQQETAWWECPCVEQWKLRASLSLADVPKMYQELSFADGTQIPKNAEEVLRDYSSNIAHYVRSGVGMFLHGDRRTGKTLAAALALKMVMKEVGGTPFFTLFTLLMDAYQQGWRDREAAQQYDARIRNASFLVIDELGKEGADRGQKEYLRSQVDEIIRHRSSSLLPTIITSELDLEETQRRYGGGVSDMLSGSAFVVSFKGDTYDVERRRRFEKDMRISRPAILSNPYIGERS